MNPSTTLRATHKPLIRFLGSRAKLWKDASQHAGPHPLTPTNLVKHVAQSSPANSNSGQTVNVGAIEFSQLATKYRRAPISEIEMEAIESGGATHII
ncbi:MAG: hypothetical protein EXX96DRAFT_574731 [Benjaminiella poitrasii]|nr:MAG: hypothetical protein EXX96DRAFT_574731 [Benjaminiella poitrasii]